MILFFVENVNKNLVLICFIVKTVIVRKLMKKKIAYCMENVKYVFKSVQKKNWCSSCGFQNIKKQNVIFFKKSDYDLDLDERETKFKDYDLILCGKCNQIFYYNSYCKHCYDKEANEAVRNNMQYK